jgi:eukaryotic-like serine/threonine-protein kinase
MPGIGRDRWQVLSPLLDQGLELTGAQRAAWLESLRAKDPALAGELQTLLEERDALSRDGFLEGAAAALPPRSSLEGQTIGHYTLVSLIGQGGMGSVWLARRSDGLFEGVAAVKLLNAELVGRGGEERFKREGGILARLTHPHIAHLVDAGVSAAGQPYLVLEHVDGEHIDRHCDGAGLGIEARIRLFLDVLAAVEHAHAHLIVHRDLKPSNVLVRGDGEVKLLDFGIAKLLESDAGGGEATSITREGGRALTPEYAAPEQLTGGPITTATDVYSLGVLLHLLLGGGHPAGPALRSPAELLRAIVDSEPPRLSDAAADATARTAGDAAAHRATRNRLRRALRGDLDTIVAKALKKDPRERYASVASLADDLERYLKDEPISARPDTLAYRAAKFVRRNRTAVALAGAAVVALGAGLVGTLTQARRADHEAHAASAERDFALRQLSRAEAINELNAFLLSDAAPSGKPFTVGDLLARASQVAEREHGETAENRVEILVTIGRQYQTLDEHDKARRTLGKAYELAGRLQEPSIRARAACALAGAISAAGETERAEKLIREGLGQLPDDPQFALHRAFCLLRGSEVAREGGDVQAGVERARAAQRLLAGSHLASASMELTVSIEVAEAYRMAGRDRDAAAAFREAMERLSSLGREKTEQAGTLLNNWGLAVDRLGRPLEAEQLFRRAIAISSADGTERSVSPMLLNNLARELRELGRLSEAADYAERAYTEARRAGDQIVVNQALFERARVYRERHDLARAANTISELEPRLRRMLGRGHVAFASLELEQALLAQARGDLPAAKAGADRAVAIAEASTQHALYLTQILLRRSDLELQTHLLEEARADAARALGLSQTTAEPGTFSSWHGRACLALGRALRAQGKLDEASTALASALEHLEASLGADHPETREARQLAAPVSPFPSRSRSLK